MNRFLLAVFFASASQTFCTWSWEQFGSFRTTVARDLSEFRTAVGQDFRNFARALCGDQCIRMTGQYQQMEERQDPDKEAKDAGFDLCDSDNENK